MGLNDKIKEEVVKVLEENKVKEKKWKFPFGKKVGKGQKKKGYVTTLILNENGQYEFKKYQIKDQIIVHDVIPRLATTGHVMFDKKGNPLIILPNWSIEPFSTYKHYEESLTNGTNKNGYKLLMNYMLANKTDAKKEMGGIWKWIIGLLVVGVIVYAFATGGGA